MDGSNINQIHIHSRIRGPLTSFIPVFTGTIHPTECRTTEQLKKATAENAFLHQVVDQHHQSDDQHEVKTI